MELSILLHVTLSTILYPPPIPATLKVTPFATTTLNLRPKKKPVPASLAFATRQPLLVVFRLLAGVCGLVVCLVRLGRPEPRHKRPPSAALPARCRCRLEVQRLPPVHSAHPPSLRPQLRERQSATRSPLPRSHLRLVLERRVRVSISASSCSSSKSARILLNQSLS